MDQVPNSEPPIEPLQPISPVEAPRTAEERRLRRPLSARTIRAIKAEHAAHRTEIQRLADRLTKFASSAPFLILHAAWFGSWILWNSGLLGLKPFDPYPFGLLTMVVSLEAIFLSIFILMSQGREASIAELREEVTLQVNLRIEAEVTKMLQLQAGLYSRLGYKVGEDPELLEMLQPFDSSIVEQQLMEQIQHSVRSRARDK